MSKHNSPTGSARRPLKQPMALPPLAGSRLLTKDEWVRVASTLRLSGRELDIVHDVFDNHTEHAIAADHHLADGTIHTHLKRLYRKLSVTSRVALVLRVMEVVLAARGCSDQLVLHSHGNKEVPLRRRRVSSERGTSLVLEFVI